MTFIIKIPLTKKDIKRIEQKYTSLELPKEKTVHTTCLLVKVLVYL